MIGGGIGGLTAAIALRRRGFDVDLIERDADWSVHGVGIMQQSSVVRAMDQLGPLDEYVAAGQGCDQVEIFISTGRRVAIVPSPSWSRVARRTWASAARPCSGSWPTARGTWASPSAWASPFRTRSTMARASMSYFRTTSAIDISRWSPQTASIPTRERACSPMPPRRPSPARAFGGTICRAHGNGATARPFQRTAN
ncbi:NAD(P)-binding protein [uncultured Sphingomonas sp.]|uniref:NAD(P)-binding protein n=1 Tax=uncultured Sphingomonas sp. TaxID=158754 RepID=UPI003747B59B